MGILARLIVLLPLALSIVGIILSSLCLFAGRDRGFMEDYDIVRLNTSKIGQNIIPWDDISLSDVVDNFKFKRSDMAGDLSEDIKDSLGDAKDKLDETAGDAKDKFDEGKEDVKDKIDEVENDVKNKTNEVANDLAEEIADRLDISDWYSVHVMSACHGYWEPDATDPSPALNVSGCSTSSPTYRLNLTDMIDKEIEVGKLGINLADINWPPEIQEKLDLINDLLLAIFIVYVIGMGFAALSVLGCLAALILVSSRLLTLINFIFASLAAVALTVGSIIVTVAGTKGVSELNNVAKEVSVHATRGRNFLIISWVAAGCMIGAMVFWTTRFCVLCVQKRREKKHVAHKGSY